MEMGKARRKDLFGLLGQISGRSYPLIEEGRGTFHVSPGPSCLVQE